MRFSKYRPTHIHVLSDMRAASQPTFVFIYGLKTMEKTPGFKSIEHYSNICHVKDTPPAKLEYLKKIEIPKMFSDYPLQKADLGFYVGHINYLYSQKDRTYSIYSYHPKPDAASFLRGLGIGYYLEGIAVRMLIEKDCDPSTLLFRISENPDLVNDKRLGQTGKVGIEPGILYMAQNWFEVIDKGVQARADAHKNESFFTRLWRRFHPPGMDISADT